MTSTTSDGSILKSDTKGRVRVPAEQREALLDEFETSGLSGIKFAALAGVKYPTFANWLQRRRKARAKVSECGDHEQQQSPSLPLPAKPVRLFEAFAEMGRNKLGAALRIELPGGASLVLDSPAQVSLAAELLQRLHSQNGSHAC